MKQNTTTRTRIFALRSLWLSLGYFLWWFTWGWLSLSPISAVSALLQDFWAGLPIWFWLSCIFSLLLLFLCSYFFLPKESSKESNQESITNWS